MDLISAHDFNLDEYFAIMGYQNWKILRNSLVFLWRLELKFQRSEDFGRFLPWSWLGFWNQKTDKWLKISEKLEKQIFKRRRKFRFWHEECLWAFKRSKKTSRGGNPIIVFMNSNFLASLSTFHHSINHDFKLSTPLSKFSSPLSKHKKPP